MRPEIAVVEFVCRFHFRPGCYAISVWLLVCQVRGILGLETQESQAQFSSDLYGNL